MNFKIDKFVVAIIIVVLFAYLFPNAAGDLPLNTIGSIGVSLIFFFYGLKLSPEKIKAGLKNWKLHVLVQATTFLIFPLIVLCFYPWVNETNKTLWLGFLFLAALPSTVSSSVVMVSIAKGNITAAIFNASISGLIGVLVTPIWMGLFLNSNTADYSLVAVYKNLFLEILAPVILGLLLHRFLGSFAIKHKNYLTLFDKSVILIIIYKSFSKSFSDGIFNGLGLPMLAGVFIVAVLLFFTIYFLIGFISKQLQFNEEDKITAQFCGTKKSLVHGTVFSKILFQNASFLGIILLPVMLFHAFQILTISVIAAKKAKHKI
ncbi:bile acid:sodium symporter family protein [Neotamlana laminarinivorans]|uniref:Bile acid:sodium symporter n=1 Tax=Neotamlana laminarinivorans TaxID=2883124 RepID=A0A9X1I4I7_9FLAO|nr:bile acid:sodium symporter family protein [Tamlana laminarinivorans]MCB4799854.1 bile acid:sodium symporter [Tamlana laminarinivorans]